MEVSFLISYQVVEETMHSREVGTYTSFGVCAYREEKRHRREVARISDVFLNTETARQFVNTCNKLQLDIIHLPEVIEDILQVC